MTRNKHISRDHDANKVRTIRYDDDDFLLEIFKYDKKYEQFFITTSGVYNKSGNCTKLWFSGMTTLYAKDDKPLKLGFNYYAPENGACYRAELLYGNTYWKTLKKDKTKDDCSILSIKVSNSKGDEQIVLNKTVTLANDVTFNRHYQYLELAEGNNYIEYELSTNTAFFGLAIKKYDVYEAHRDARNSDPITMIGNEVEHYDELAVNTMKAELMYYHGLDEKLEPTDPKANRSGLVFDYRDEINYYVKSTNNTMVQVFGGYINNLDVDKDLKIITLNCSDRLIDMERRYCLSEIQVGGKEADTKRTYARTDYYKAYDNNTDPLRFLTKHTEVPLMSNVASNDPLVPKKTKTLATYGKKKYNKFSMEGINCTIHDDYIYIRNRNDLDKQQNIVIYDAKDKPVLLNDYPNLDIKYGMGKEVWEEKLKETKIVNVGISASETKQADDITKGVGNNAIKPMWAWIVKNIKHEYIEGFYQSPQKTLSRKRANCCCKAELLLDWCAYKGVTDLKYVHVKAGTKGHVFCRINGMIVDPSTSRGWGNYARGYGVLGSGKTTNYPTKPF